MDFALVYIVNRFFYRVYDFFHHWYFRASQTLIHTFISFLESLDRTLAIKITIRHFFEPLYKDYTILGRILGVIFRSGRILIGVIVYLLFGIIFVVIFSIWILIPPALILYAARNI